MIAGETERQEQRSWWEPAANESLHVHGVASEQELSLRDLSLSLPPSLPLSLRPPRSDCSR